MQYWVVGGEFNIPVSMHACEGDQMSDLEYLCGTTQKNVSMQNSATGQDCCIGRCMLMFVLA